MADVTADVQSKMFVFSRDERGRKLLAIKAEMEKRPSLGSFHIWYYDVFKILRNKDNEGYVAAINKKYDELGLGNESKQ